MARRAWRRLVAVVRKVSVRSLQSATGQEAPKGNSGQQLTATQPQLQLAEPPVMSEEPGALARSGPAMTASGGLPTPATSLISPFATNADSLEPGTGSPDSSPELPRDSPSSSFHSAAKKSTVRSGGSPALMPLYRHTMLRLRTGAFERIAGAATSSLKQGEEEQEAHQGSGMAPSQGLAELASHDSASVGALGQGVQIRLAQRYHPMLTPSGCAMQLPISPQEAADIYTGK